MSPHDFITVCVIVVVVIGFIFIWIATEDDQQEYHNWVNQKRVFDNLEEIPMELELKAKVLLVDYYNERTLSIEQQVTVDDIAVVWFAKTLQNWKTILIIRENIGEGGQLFEITYNGDKGEAYIDAYTKYENVVVKDDPIVMLREKLSGNARDI